MTKDRLKQCEVAVIGEAIIDLIPEKDGSFRPCVGGSPYNVARALGLQQVPCCYLSPLSSDDFGTLLSAQIRQDGVMIDAGFKVDRPTSLAVINLDKNGAPKYSLYREGIADREFSASDVIDRLPPDLKLLHTGSLAIVPDDSEKIIEIFTELKTRGVLISVDLNVRPNVVRDHDVYIDFLKSLGAYCDILKASDEDLRYLGFENDWAAIMEDLLEANQGGLVAVTTGSRGAYLANQKNLVELKAFPIGQVEDSVGAGDCFQAGMIAALHGKGFLSREMLEATSSFDLQDILKVACATAAINVTRKGCNPPTHEEVNQFLDNSQ